MGNSVSERQLTTELEHGNTEHVNGFFSGQFEEQRIGAVSRMRDLYLADVKAGTVQQGTLDFGVRQWFGENIDISYKGNNVYHDTFDIASLKHSAPGDTTPDNRQAFDPAKIRQVTTDLEKGNPDSLKAALGGLYAEEQQRYLTSIQSLNQQDRESHLTDVGLYTYNGWNKNPQMMLSLNRYATGFKNDLTNPFPLYTETVDSRTGQQTVTANPDTRG